MSHRVERLNNLIQEEVSQTLHREVEFGLGVLVTVTGVKVSVDAAHATVYISVLPKNQLGKVFKILKNNIYSVQQILNKRLKMKLVPKIRFEADKGEENFEKVEKIIDDINNL